MKFLSYLKKAITLPPHVALRKAFRLIKKECLNRKKQFFDHRFSTYAQKCPFSSLNHYVKKIDIGSFPVESIMSLNEHYLNHEFNLLGSGWVKVCHQIKDEGGEASRIRTFISKSYSPIDWQLDFKSGYRWSEKTWSQNILYGHEPGVDVKVPWELSRMQHLISLAWGYALAGGACYIAEFQDQILDFIASNPPRFGVNWSCTMDVGIRIANWLMAYDLFVAYGAKLDNEFQKVFIRSVYEHGIHIYSHLEWDPFLRSNHYLANLAGLFFVAAYLPRNKKTDVWLQFARTELHNEILDQFHPDGSNFEASTSYHRLSSEMVIYTTALAAELGIQFPIERIQKMGDFIRDITKPDGTIVQIGDNDSGRFFKFFPDQNELDHRYLFSAGRKRDNLTSMIEAHLRLDHVEAKVSQYPDFGLFIHNKNPWYLAIRCGSIGQKGNGGHAHNDQLSFELSVNGVSVLIDKGTYAYTPFPKERRHFRSSIMHNTLSIPGKEQNQDNGLFQMRDRSQAKVMAWEENLFVGEHIGFGSTHRRVLQWNDEYLEGIDECNIPSAQIHFHFAPGWQGQLSGETTTTWTNGSLQILLSSDSGSMQIVESEYSKGYGIQETSFSLVLNAHLKKTLWRIELIP